jgi:hypothetical protein
MFNSPKKNGNTRTAGKTALETPGKTLGNHGKCKFSREIVQPPSTIKIAMDPTTPVAWLSHQIYWIYPKIFHMIFPLYTGIDIDIDIDIDIRYRYKDKYKYRYRYGYRCRCR